MNLRDLSNRPALWLGLRQSESIREALSATLGGQSLPQPFKSMVNGVRSWLKTQNVLIEESCPEPALLNQSLNDGFENKVGIPPGMLVRGSNAPAPGWVDLGEERSGAGWRNPANFLITSAICSTSGASEQFEMDVLKVLFYYRPNGMLGNEAEWIELSVDPKLSENYTQRRQGCEQASL